MININADTVKALSTGYTCIKFDLTTMIQKPFSFLTEYAAQSLIGFIGIPKVRWEYIEDKETGLEILKSKKRSDAIENMQRMVDEIYK